MEGHNVQNIGLVPLDKPEDGIAYCVCHDGSQASDEALEFIKHGLFREDKDVLEIAHAWSKEKEQYLKYNLKKDYIRERQEADFLYLGKKFRFNEEEIVEGKTAKQILNEVCEAIKCDINVVGFHGRKGPKEDPTVMGTAV